MYLKTFYPINFQDVSWKAITFYKLAQWRAYLVFWHADVVIKEQSNVNSNLLWNLKKKGVSILDCVFNCSSCVTESFEDIIITFPGYPRTVWKRDLNAETRLLRLIPILEWFILNLTQDAKRKCIFFFAYVHNKNVDPRFFINNRYSC